MAERIMLNINHIAKTFNPGTITEKRALTDVDLKLNEGDFVTIICLLYTSSICSIESIHIKNKEVYHV